MGLFVILAIAVGLALDAFAVAVARSVSLGRVTGRQVFRFAFHFGLFQAVMPLIGWLAGRSVQQYVGAWDHWLAFGLLAFIGGKAVVDALKAKSAPPAVNESSGQAAADDCASDVGRVAPASDVGRVAPGPPQRRRRVRIWPPFVSVAPPVAGLRRAGGDPPYIPEAKRPDPTRGLTLLMLSVATSIDALAVGLSLGVLEVAIWYPALIIGVVTAALTALGMLIGSRLSHSLGARFGRWTELVGGLVLIAIGVKILVEHIA